MRHSVSYPIISHPHNPELLTQDAIVRFARAAEAAGFDGISFTEHPAPSHRWLEAGGHDALDPIVALAFVAAVTERIRLIPNIVVLPYRNPFLMAKSVATIDVLSGGRFTLATATGYLRGEYKALGVDFDERNDLFDEALEVLRLVWSEDEVVVQGRHFSASGQTANPKPGRVPIWIGGNSKLTRRRVAASADGWCPFFAPAVLATTSKTPSLESIDDLARMLDELWQLVDEAGRSRADIDVSFSLPTAGTAGTPSFDADAQLANLDAMAALGVTWTTIGVPDDSLAHALEALDEYGESVIRAGG